MHQRTKGPALQKGKRRYMLQPNIIQRDRAGRMAQHRSQGRRHECYAVRLPGFFARVVTAILVVDGVDYAENKGSWYHM